MDLEANIRARIEAVLLNDARRYADLRLMAEDDEPLGHDAFDEERNFYQRIISSYRSAVNEVNVLLEENISFLSTFCRIVENIKEKENFPEICSVIVEALLQDLGVEYCSIVLFDEPSPVDEPLHLEGIREDQKLIYIHSDPRLLGSRDFKRAVAALAQESLNPTNIPDVYQDARFDGIDFSCVVRSLACLPIVSFNRAVGALIVSHSLPHSFNDNHTRLFSILSGIISHARLLTGKRPSGTLPAPDAVPGDRQDVTSIVLMNFEQRGADGSMRPLETEAVLGLRSRLAAALEPTDILLLYDEKELLLLAPGVQAHQIPPRVKKLKDAFLDWRTRQAEKMSTVQMSFGFSSCEGSEDIARTLEVASLIMKPDRET
jgi:hypothetical protein